MYSSQVIVQLLHLLLHSSDDCVDLLHVLLMLCARLAVNCVRLRAGHPLRQLCSSSQQKDSGMHM